MLHLQCFRQLTQAECHDLNSQCGHILTELVHKVSDDKTLSGRLCGYLVQNSMSRELPRFRINAKIHKTPAQSRPISNWGGFILEPVARFVNAALIEIMRQHDTVLESSITLVGQFEGSILQPDLEFFTFDITALYPNLDVMGHQKAVLETIAPVVLQHFASIRKYNVGVFVIKCVELIFSFQLLQNQFEEPTTYWIQQRGMATGIAPATTIANLYLAIKFDKYVLDHSGIKYLRRFVDDGFGINASGLNKNELLDYLNAWHPSIAVSADALNVGENVHILDISLQLLESRQINITTYRKPQSLYDYLPINSAHPPGTFSGIVAGETQRLLLTNSRKQDFLYQMQFFSDKTQKKRLLNSRCFENCSQISVRETSNTFKAEA